MLHVLMLAALVTQTDDPLPPASQAAPLAFFCTFQAHVAPQGGGIERLPVDRDLRFLLADDPDTVDESAAIQTRDPTNLLGGGRFVSFTREVPQGEAYSAVTAPVDGKRWLLQMLYRARGTAPVHQAVLGEVGAGSRYLGFCLPLRSEDTAADFERGIE